MRTSVAQPLPFVLLGALAASLACGDDGGAGPGGGTATGGGTGTSGSAATVDDTAAADGTTSGAPEGDLCAIGEAVFDEGMVHELDMQLSEADWAAMIQEAMQSPEYGGPDKIYYDADFLLDGIPLGSPVALRLKGHSSLLGAVEEGRSFPLKIDFNRVDAGQDLDGLTKVNLHPNLDGITAINEYLSYGAIRAHGVPTARLGFARVTVNGEALGLYTLVEQIKGKFVRCHYSEPYGDLYKPEEPLGNLAWLGASITDYEPEIQFKWPDASGTDHGSLLNLLDVINTQSVGSFPSVLEVSEVLTYLAMNAGLGNYDYYSSFGHNYYLYESTAGRFTMIPWDMNFSQGVLDHPCGFGRNTEEWPVSNTLLGDPATVQEYLGILEGFLGGAASPQSLGARLDAVLPILGADIDASAVDELRTAIDLRVQLQLATIAQGLQVCPEFADGGGEDACDVCIDESCDPQLIACEKDPPCSCVLECVGDDGEEDQCLNRCGLAGTPAAFNDLLTCITANCAASCG